VLSQSDENLLKFEWFIDEGTNTATLLEVFANAEGFEVLAGKVMGTPVNLKFRELFKVEKMTILGEPTESLKETISVMSPVIKPYIGGLN
jgi:transcription elongation GreA/GreB family factor